MTFSARGRERAGEMLQAGKVVDADVSSDHGVPLAICSGVNQGSRTSPIFVRGMRKEYFRRDLLALRAVQQASSLVCDRIDFWLVGKGKDVGGEEDRRGWLGITGGLRKPVIETAPACAGDMREHTIESDAPLFVGVKALVQKIAQESSILRD